MNERILELAAQVGLGTDHGGIVLTKNVNAAEALGKFAELIIKECVDCIYIDEHSPSYEAVGRIYDHFRGVES